jgi:hypothetical protein
LVGVRNPPHRSSKSRRILTLTTAPVLGSCFILNHGESDKQRCGDFFVSINVFAWLGTRNDSWILFDGSTR